MHVFFQPKGWRFRKKTHASSPSTSGKTHEKTCPVQTRRETRESIRKKKPRIDSALVSPEPGLVWWASFAQPFVSVFF